MKIKTSELSGVALDWAVAMVQVEAGNFTTGPEDCESGTPYLTVDDRGVSLWGEGAEQIGTINKDTGKPWVFHGAGGQYSPSTKWRHGGNLVEAHQINLSWDGVDGVALWWRATHQDIVQYQIGDTPLIAACRAIIAAKLGDEVDVPEGLV